MGDIDQQTLAGAISTGTHGSGGHAAGLAAQLVGLELVTGTGEVLRASAEENPDVFAVARVGLGALGVLTTLTFQVEPLFVLEAHEQPMSWDAALGGFDQMTAESHHVDMYWFPHTDRVLLKRNDRLDVDLDEAEPLPRWRAALDDDLLSNRLFGVLCAVGNAVPGRRPADQPGQRPRCWGRAPTATSRTGCSPPSAASSSARWSTPCRARPAWRRCARPGRCWTPPGSGWASRWRCAPRRPTTSPCRPPSGRDSLYLAFHVHRDAEHREYFALMEQVMRAHDGRPHWGKVHTRTAADLAPAYPRFEEFLAVRDRLDPDRVFANPYLRRVLGD